MLQQLQNLASDNIIHGYPTCLLVESFLFFFSPENRCLNRCNVSFAESRVEDCLELNFRYDYQTILQFLYLLDLCAHNKSATFLECPSIG